MLIQSSLSQKEFAKLTAILLLKRLQILFLVTAIFILAIAGSIATFVYHNESAYMLVIVSIAFLLLFSWSIYSNSKRHYASNKQIQLLTDYQFSQHGFSISKEGYQSQVSWKEVKRIRRSMGLILIWQNKLIATVLSSKDVDQKQWEDLKQLAQQAGVSVS